MTYHYKKPPNQRQMRVAELIREETARIFMREEVYLPGFDSRSINLSYVTVTPDLGFATIFVVPTTNDTQGLLAQLSKSAFLVRKLLSDRLKLRVSPVINFALDNSWQGQFNIDRFFRSLTQE